MGTNPADDAGKVSRPVALNIAADAAAHEAPVPHSVSLSSTVVDSATHYALLPTSLLVPILTVASAPAATTVPFTVAVMDWFRAVTGQIPHPLSPPIRMSSVDALSAELPLELTGAPGPRMLSSELALPLQRL